MRESIGQRYIRAARLSTTSSTGCYWTRMASDLLHSDWKTLVGEATDVDGSDRDLCTKTCTGETVPKILLERSNTKAGGTHSAS